MESFPTLPALCLSGILFVLSLSYFYAKDLWWERQEISNKRQGIVEFERTPEWDESMQAKGIVFLMVGLALLVVVICVSSQ